MSNTIPALALELAERTVGCPCLLVQQLTGESVLTCCDRCRHRQVHTQECSVCDGTGRVKGAEEDAALVSAEGTETDERPR